MIIAEIVFFVSLLAILAPYVLYPLGVVALSRLRRERPEPAESTPTVSLVISAFNESRVIRRKLENSLAIDYPADRLEIIVISDSSDDGTDEIVTSFADPRVRLCRQEPRGGKTRGITRFMPETRGEIVIFSDANSIYDPQAVRYLTRHFSDPQMGYVVGYQRYISDADSPVSVSEDTYWRYETVMKRAESRLSSVVGGDGAIFAIRRELFTPLADDEINDFVTPLQIVAAGYRGTYESRAVCDEHTAADFAGEFRRKVRIANRSFRAILRVPQTLNPFRTGWFAAQLFVHKILRWFVPLFLVTFLVSSVYLAVATRHPFFELAVAGQAVFYGIALLHLVPRLSQLRVVYLVYYFCQANLAAALGVAGVFFGRKIVVWQPQREAEPVADALGGPTAGSRTQGA